MKASLTGLGAAALALALAACAPQSSPLKLGPLQTAASAPPQAAAAGGGNAASQTQAPAPAPPEGPRSFTSPGTGVFVNPASAGAARPALVRTGANGQTSLNLVDASIPEAANAVLGDALGLNYVVKPTVSGSVTLQTSTPLGPDALLEAFQTALEYNGATLIDGGGLVSIVPVTDAPPRFVEIGDQRGAGRRIVVVPLEYVSAADMVRLLEPVATGSTVLDVNQERNILMVTGGAAEIDAVLDAVNLFDVDVLSGKSFSLVKLQAANPRAVAEELSVIFETEPGGSLEGVVSFVPNERLGSILVISSRAKYLARARQLIRELDATAGQSRRYPEVYLLQNRTAEDIQPVLAELINLSDDDRAAQRDDLLVFDDGAPQIVGDPIRNAIIVWGTLDEHRDIGALISKLDATPTQVLLEATIAEVSLNDELEFGVRWFLESGNFSGRLSDAESGAVAPSFPGFSFLFNAAGARVALNALSAVTDVRVVSAPSVLVLDNREAELRVGDQVPIATESAVNTQDANAPIVNSISLRDTGVILKVRPRVSESGRIIMDIEQEVSEVTPTTTSGIDSPTISQRIVRTSVSVDNGETLALGGLVRDGVTNVKTRLPILGDIPVIGAAFGATDDVESRSELLILITPRVIRNADEARAVTEEFRRRLAGPDALLRGGAGGGRHQIQRIAN